MLMEAVRMPEQDILSAVMRRQIIRHADPYLSLDPKANPLFRCGDAVQNLVRTYRGEVKTLLSTLSRGKISISDFSAAIDELLGRIKESVGDDISAFSEIEIAVFHIRKHIDVVCTEARGFIASPPENDINLGWPDAELLRQVETARAQVASKAVSPQQAVTCPAAVAPAPVAVSAPVMAASAVAPAPAPGSPEPEKCLQVIGYSADTPLKDHPEYGQLVMKFLLKRDITDATCPKMTVLYKILSELPLGNGLSKAVLQERLGINYGAICALLFRLKEKGLFLGRKTPQNPGCFIRVTGRDRSGRKGRSLGRYCYGLVLAVEEKIAKST